MKIVTPERITVLTAGEANVIQAHVPHYFRALDDCLMIEFWDGPFEARYYEPYRRLIDPDFKS